MKTLFYTFLLFMVSKTYCQSTSGSVIYNIKPIDFEIPVGTDAYTKRLLEESELAAEKQSFILEFNSTKSKFVAQELLVLDGNAEEAKFFNTMGAIRFTSMYDYFLDLEGKYELFKNNDGSIIKNEYVKIDWEITTESKTIDGYLCYKAIYNKSYLARDNKTKVNKIVAWFAPSLPYGFGPKEYTGTPGLILELQEFQTTFYASKINILKDTVLTIDFPKGKTITEEIHNKKTQSN